MWEFPGGKIQESESPESCLERELLEELGVTTKIGKTLAVSEYTYEHGAFQVIAMSAEILDGDLELTVHDKALWVPVEQLSDYHLAPADVQIADELLRIRDEL